MKVRLTNRLQIELLPVPTPTSFIKRVAAWFAAPPLAYRLTADLNAVIDGEPYVVKRGVVIDGFTSPRGTRWVLSPMGPHAEAAIVHDDMYNRGYRTKRYADDVFNALLKYLNCPAWARVLAYYGVRFFGKGKYYA